MQHGIANDYDVTDFKKKFGEIVEAEELTDEPIHNMDETEQNFKMLPKTIFLGSHENSRAHTRT